MSRGPLRRAARQRAARNSSAVESGPPETASTTLANSSRSANSFAVSRADSGAAGAASAAGTLLFPLDALLEGDRGAGIFASDLIECRACRVFLAERRQRLAEAEQRVRRLARGLVFGRDREEQLGSIAVPLTLEQGLAEPIIGVGDESIAGISFQEPAKALLGQRIVLVQDIAVREVVFVLGGGARRHHGLRRRGGRVARRRHGSVPGSDGCRRRQRSRLGRRRRLLARGGTRQARE